MDGAAERSQFHVVMEGAPPLHLPNAELRFAGQYITLEAGGNRDESNETGAIQGIGHCFAEAGISRFRATAWRSLRCAGRLPLAGIPVLSQCDLRQVEGRSALQPDCRVGGAINLEDADIPFEAFAAPLHLFQRMPRSMGPSRDEARGSNRGRHSCAGGIPVRTLWRPRPHKFRITVPSASGPAIEKLFDSGAAAGQFSYLRLQLRPRAGAGLVAEHAGRWNHQAGSLDLGGGRFTKVRSRVIWKGRRSNSRGLKSQFGDAAFAGGVTIRLAGRQPAYEVEGKLDGCRGGERDTRRGRRAGDFGTGTDLLAICARTVR